MDDKPEALEQAVGGMVQDRINPGVSSPNKGRRFKAAAGFLAFFLGLSLVLSSLGAMAGRLAWERGAVEWWKDDWQETEAFRAETAAYLREFLTLAAGGRLDWYDTEVVREAVSGTAASLYAEVAYVDTPVRYEPEADKPGNEDFYYRSDKNVLYKVSRYGVLKYSNLDSGQQLDSYDDLPEGYNFFLAFRPEQGGTVSIWKDGAEVDVYGGGILTGESDWFVPGYENFPAGEDVRGVTICMAVRETPVLYYQRDYADGGYTQGSRMYYVCQSLQEGRGFYFRQAALLGLGLLLLAVWFIFRREKRLADQKIASWTIHVWTELRFLAVVLPLAALLTARGWNVFRDIWWSFSYSYVEIEELAYWLPELVRSLAAGLENTGALLCLVWAVWLIHNDHRYNPREKRRNLWRFISVRLPKYPFQKRMNRLNLAAAVLVCVLPVTGVLSAISMGLSPLHWLFWLMAAVPVIAAAALLLILRKHAALARDVGRLSGQVESIRNGDLTTPLDLPEDADLRQTAESLNDIQAGMHKALEEQTRSERMKVELISNVSHDLKTPLTSILSYAELLRQEPLEGAAADYARIIDEKAQRLKAMVQDVFEVSKAAADQLPVQLERLDLAKLLRQTLADMDGPIQASRLTFKLDLPEDPVMIVADGKRLYRVFQNLIQNALQYALEGSRAYLSLKTGAGRAEASLRNTSRSELPEGVDFTARFVRGDESRTGGGSGLGLSIASSFTEACGGEFRVETVADLFTAVVTFPLAGE